MYTPVFLSRSFTVAPVMLDPLPDIGLILRNAGVRGILWGEQAMLRCGIRTMLFVKFTHPTSRGFLITMILQRDDTLIPDDDLDLAVSTLLVNGWITSTGPLPTSREGWRSGRQVNLVGSCGTPTSTTPRPSSYFSFPPLSSVSIQTLL